MSRTYINQFPSDYDVPKEIVKLVEDGKIADSSNGNDTTPSFEILKDGSVRLQTDHPDPAKREMQGKRFQVCLFDSDGDYLGTAIDTDSINEVLYYLKDHWDI